MRCFIYFICYHGLQSYDDENKLVIFKVLTAFFIASVKLLPLSDLGMLELRLLVQAGPWCRRGRLQKHDLQIFPPCTAAAIAADLAALKFASMSGERLQEDAPNVMHMYNQHGGPDNSQRSVPSVPLSASHAPSSGQTFDPGG